MDLADLTVEVREKSLRRLGIIRPEELILELDDEFNNVGSWSLKLASEHPLAAPLRQPGSGIIVTGPNDVLLSGPTTTNSYLASASDPAGSVSYSGVSDTVVLADVLSWPQPSNVDPTTQTFSHDERTGTAEALMHAYVNANCGPTAPLLRRKANLTMGPNLNRGPVRTKRARFPVLGNLLAELAILGNLGFRVVQKGATLVFETYTVADRSLEIRLDVLSNTLASQSVAIQAPSATHVIVAGQGDLVERQFLAATNPEALAAEAAWGRRIERFLDQRQTDDPTEHQKAADELLAEEGFTGVGVQVVPTDDSTMRFGYEWDLGDKVAVVVNGGEVTATVTGYKLLVDNQGVRLGARIGDTRDFDRVDAQSRRLESTTQRVSALERESGTGGSSDASIFNLMGVW